MIGPSEFRHRNKVGRFTIVSPSDVIRSAGICSADDVEWHAATGRHWSDISDERFSSVVMANFVLTHLLAGAGLSPANSRKVVGEAIAPVFYNAFMFADNALEVIGQARDVTQFRRDFMASAELANELTGGPHRGLYISSSQCGCSFFLAAEACSNPIQNKPIIALRDVATELMANFGRPLLSVELLNHQPITNKRETWMSKARET